MIKTGQWVNIKANAGTYATIGRITDVLDGEAPTYVINATDCEGRRSTEYLSRNQFTIRRPARD